MTMARPPSTPSPAALHTEAKGRGPRLVLAHGFTQTGRVWGGMDDDLAADHRVVLVDMPGHAGSSQVAATMSVGAGLLGEVGERAAYLGYSMGARFCLHLALARPELVERLVLISGTAGIEDPGDRLARRISDGALAEDLDPMGDGGSPPTPVESFLRRWLENPMFADIDDRANGFTERLRNTGPGLASSLRLAGTGTQEPLWEYVGTLSMPVLVISGGNDERFTAIGHRLVEAIGANATHHVVTGAGHAPHLQRPDQVARLVRAHLDHATTE
jgi:2-succinyl-6-hydroxy-2,4-cyclohexadiene-1-carboxylate synthase